jgi:SSS family solute:Na+ symporter/sodium/pantothenate symporter
MPILTTTVVTFVGLAAIPAFANLGRVEADTVMPRLLEQWSAAGPGATLLAVTVFLGALAAIMSTADSVLLSLASVIAGDLFGNTGEEETGRAKRIAIVTMAVMVLFALGGRVTLWRLIELKMEVLIQTAPAFLLALHWNGMRTGATLAGVLAGTAVAVICVLADVSRIGGIHVGLIGLVVNLAIAVAGSWRR